MRSCAVALVLLIAVSAVAAKPEPEPIKNVALHDDTKRSMMYYACIPLMMPLVYAEYSRYFGLPKLS